MKNKLIIFLFFLFFSLAAHADSITIGSKNFTEQAILGEIMAQLIEDKTDIEVKRKFFLGGSAFTFEALKNGDIDIYPEYTGTGLVSILKMKPVSDPDRAYEIVKKQFSPRYHISWLMPFGFNNTYAMAYRPDDKNFSNQTDLSQIKELVQKIRFGAPHE